MSVTVGTGTIFSSPATLTIVLVPTIVQPVPALQITAVAVKQSAGCASDGTIFYHWRRVLTNGSSLVVANHLTNLAVDFLTVPNVAPAFDGAYFTVLITNLAYFAQNRIYTNCFLTALADANSNGIPDVWRNRQHPFGSLQPH